MQKKDKLKAGLIGVGGRGSGAITDCLTGNQNVEIVALADVFEDHLERNLARLQAKFPNQVKVDAEHRFTGFDAYQETGEFRHRHRHAHHAARLPPRALRGGCRGKETHLLRKADRHRSRRRAPFHGGREEGRATQALRRLRSAAALRHRVHRNRQEDSGRRHRRDHRALLAVSQRPGVAREGPQAAVGRHGIRAPQLVFLHLDLRRPDRRAAFPQHRLHELGDGNAPGEGDGIRRGRMAQARTGLRQHLRPHDVGFRLPERRAPHQPLPPVPNRVATARWTT